MVKNAKSAKSAKHSKKGALVKGYLEKKDREGVILMLDKYKGVIGSSAGIYALYNNDKLYYVGIANNLLQRVYWHTRDKHKNRWNRVSFFVIDKHKYSKDMETVILRIAEPEGNGTRGKFEGHYIYQDKLNKVRIGMKRMIKKL